MSSDFWWRKSLRDKQRQADEDRAKYDERERKKREEEAKNRAPKTPPQSR